MLNINRPMEDWEKALLGVVVVIIIIASFYIFADRTRTIKNFPSTKEGPIVAFGDSLTEGYGSERGGGWVSFLEDRIGKEIINEGVSGDTTAQGLARISDVLAHNPKIVFLGLGGNDALQRIDQTTTRQNLDKIISQLQNQGSIVVLLGVRGGLFGDGGFGKMYRDLADRHQTALVPDILKGLFRLDGQSPYMSDDIHPNDAGYAKIADRIFLAIIELDK